MGSDRAVGHPHRVLKGLSAVCLVLVLLVGCGDQGPPETSASTGRVEDNLPSAATTLVVPKTELPPTTASPATTTAPTTSAAPTTTVPPTTIAPTTTTTAPPPPPPTTAAPAPAQNCHPSYDPCLAPASDYDCAGGSGNGPAYTGRVNVIGPDEYDLDRDGDGVGCE
jgi:hypothetical protein